MRVFIVGNKGQLGQDMMIYAKKVGFDVIGKDYPDIDITKKENICDILKEYMPKVVINCAAYTAVDDCENNIEKAYDVNARGVKYLAEACSRINAKIVHISTDYVFDGLKKKPYVEEDKPNPLSVYGKSKLEGERALIESYDKYFIFRVAWLYGTRGNNFLKTICNLAKKRLTTKEPLKVVNDQIGTPTYTMHVCKQIFNMINTDLFGLYHCTNEGWCSWYDFACAIVKAYSIPVNIVPCTTKEFPRPAKRPANSVLENKQLKKLNLNIMPHWEHGLRDYLEEEKINAFL